jgi:hypothetical protein
MVEGTTRLAQRIALTGVTSVIMRNLFRSGVFAVVCGLVAVSSTVAATQETDGDEYTGQWTGTWEGPGTGTFDLLLQKNGDGKPAGKVSVTTDGGNYDAELRNIVYKAKGIEAAYDFPLDPSAEVVMTATVDGSTAKGTWSLRPKGGGAAVANGTFTLTKK